MKKESLFYEDKRIFHLGRFIGFLLSFLSVSVFIYFTLNYFGKISPSWSYLENTAVLFLLLIVSYGVKKTIS